LHAGTYQSTTNPGNLPGWTDGLGAKTPDRDNKMRDRAFYCRDRGAVSTLAEASKRSSAGLGAPNFGLRIGLAALNTWADDFL